jgi:hypothetical protein
MAATVPSARTVPVVVVVLAVALSKAETLGIITTTVPAAVAAVLVVRVRWRLVVAPPLVAGRSLCSKWALR